MSRNAPYTSEKGRSAILARWAPGHCLRFFALCIAWAPALLFPLTVRAEALPLASTDPTQALVVTVKDSQAVDAFQPRAEVVRAMVQRAILRFTGRRTIAEAWRSVVSPQDVVGIKVYSVPGPNSGTRPAVVGPVIEGLLQAGIPTNHIIIWDKQATDLRLAGFFDLAARYGVRAAGSAQTGYDPTNFYDSAIIGNLVWGDFEFGKQGPGIGRRSFVSRLVSQQMTKIINITPLLNQNLAGVSGNLYGLAVGSVDNVARFESDAGRLAIAIPEIYAMRALSDHVVLNIVDALICQYEGGERSLLHYSDPLDEIRISRDPVALDVLSLKDLQRERNEAGFPSLQPNMDLYNNAALLQLGVSDLKQIRVERVP